MVRARRGDGARARAVREQPADLVVALHAIRVHHEPALDLLVGDPGYEDGELDVVRHHGAVLLVQLHSHLQLVDVQRECRRGWFCGDLPSRTKGAGAH